MFLLLIAISVYLVTVIGYDAECFSPAMESEGLSKFSNIDVRTRLPYGSWLLYLVPALVRSVGVSLGRWERPDRETCAERKTVKKGT